MASPRYTGREFANGRVSRDFSLREGAVQNWLQENTWCSGCRLPDLGIDDPREFEAEGQVFIEGSCRICRLKLTSEVVDQRTAAAT